MAETFTCLTPVNVEWTYLRAIKDGLVYGFKQPNTIALVCPSLGAAISLVLSRTIFRLPSAVQLYSQSIRYGYFKPITPSDTDASWPPWAGLCARVIMWRDYLYSLLQVCHPSAGQGQRDRQRLRRRRHGVHRGTSSRYALSSRGTRCISVSERQHQRLGQRPMPKLGPGDFASVPPGVIHQYQILGHYTEFVGLIVPGE